MYWSKQLKQNKSNKIKNILNIAICSLALWEDKIQKTWQILANILNGAIGKEQTTWFIVVVSEALDLFPTINSNVVTKGRKYSDLHYQ